MKKNMKACIFDLDGTLLDTLTSLWYCANLSLKKEGLMELPRDKFRYYVGDGALTQVERYLKDTYIIGLPETETGLSVTEGGAAGKASVKGENAEHRDLTAAKGRIDAETGIPDPHDPANLGYYFESYMRELNRHADYEVKPYNGIPEVLKAMKSAGLRLAVFSNKPDAAAQKVIHEYFGDTFDIVLGKKDENPKKPDPTGALMIAESFGVKSENIMYMGDTDTDMQTGKNAGMFTVGVLWGFRDRAELEKNHADAIVESPAELLEYI